MRLSTYIRVSTPVYGLNTLSKGHVKTPGVPFNACGLDSLPLYGSLIHPGSAPFPQSIVSAIPLPVISVVVPPPCSCAPQALPPSNEFLTQLALPDLSNTNAAIVLDPNVSTISVVAAANGAAAMVPPALLDFGRVSAVPQAIIILRIYC